MSRLSRFPNSAESSGSARRRNRSLLCGQARSSRAKSVDDLLQRCIANLSTPRSLQTRVLPTQRFGVTLDDVDGSSPNVASSHGRTHGRDAVSDASPYFFEAQRGQLVDKLLTLGPSYPVGKAVQQIHVDSFLRWWRTAVDGPLPRWDGVGGGPPRIGPHYPIELPVTGLEPGAQRDHMPQVGKVFG